MKKLVIILLLIMLTHNSASAESVVFVENEKFGLKDENGNIIINPIYKKLIKLGNYGWIIQQGTKFGIIDNNGNILVEPKFNRADRILGKYAKLTKGEKCGLYDENGFEVLPVDYSSIDLLFGGMFLTCKKYKYGVVDMNGQTILDNIFDEIYMPKPNTMIITYNGKQYELTGLSDEQFVFPENIISSDIKITEFIQKPVKTTGYYSISATNYLLKIFSSISTAYEATIDDLMFSQGADAAGVIMKFTWLPKFPFVYVKKYCRAVAAPNNGPLQEVKTNLKKQLN